MNELFQQNKIFTSETKVIDSFDLDIKFSIKIFQRFAGQNFQEHLPMATFAKNFHQKKKKRAR